MQKSLFNAYDLLEIQTNATIAEIKSAYKTKAHAFHPDKHENSEPANVLFRLIVHAKEVLLNPASRLEHDYSLGIKTKPTIKPNPEVIYIDNTDDIVPWGTIVGVGLLGIAIGTAIGKKKKKKKRK